MGGNRRKKFKGDDEPVEEPADQTTEVAKLPKELERVLRAVPQNRKGEVASILLGVVSQYHYSGPIPPPDMLAKYDEIYPGLAKEITDVAFSQTKHRQEMEKLALPAEISRINRGQHYALIITVIGIGSAIFLAMYGHDTVAAIIGGTTVLGIVTALLTGKAKSDKK